MNVRVVLQPRGRFALAVGPRVRLGAGKNGQQRQLAGDVNPAWARSPAAMPSRVKRAVSASVRAPPSKPSVPRRML